MHEPYTGAFQPSYRTPLSGHFLTFSLGAHCATDAADKRGFLITPEDELRELMGKVRLEFCAFLF